jgi:hypothetical protein
MQGMRFGAVAFVFLMACCASKDATPVPAVADYFPLKVGLYYIYSVDSVITSQGATCCSPGIQTNYTYQLKVQVIDSFANTEGGYSYILQRSKRPDSVSAWTAMATWSARVNQFQGVVNEGNIPYIKIEGPLVNGKAWDGNGLNNLGGSDKCLVNSSSTCDIYTIQNFGLPYTQQGLSFKNSLIVVQSNNRDPIVFTDERSEVYAEKVGLIYRTILQLHFCTTDSTCLGQMIVNQGISYNQTLLSYGGL